MKKLHEIIGLSLLLIASTSFPGEDPVFSNGFEGDDICDPDISEPDLESQATFLGVITDCAPSFIDIQGVLGTPSDSDWFTYNGSDEPLCPTDPSVDILGSAGLRACIYIVCGSGDGTFSCPNGSFSTLSPDGRNGCCTTTGSMTVSDLNCPGLDESARVWLRVDQSAQECNGYSATVNF